VDLERIEVLELLGMALAHLKIAEQDPDPTPRVALLIAIRDKLARSLEDET
jgi:hypothetical protein